MTDGQGGPTSKQGQHTNRPNKIPEEMTEYVVSHIASFPAESSHYSRHHNPDRKYLAPTLSIAKMFRLYKEKCEMDNVEADRQVSERYYSDVFTSRFNLGFGNPRTDVCAKCDSNQDGDADDAHLAAVVHAKKEMAGDRTRAKEIGAPVFITFDLQKTLPLPKIPTSVAFYLRQLWFYNLGVHLVTPSEENGYMQTWLECEAGRGANEICSGLLAFFEAAKIDNTQAKHLVAWSDSCGGQNKNFTVLTLWQFLLLSKKFDVIDQKFPVVGHSYMASDADFGIIEQALRNVERVYSAENYRELIKGVKINKKPFIVQNIAGGLVNAKNFAKEMRLVKRQRNLKKEKFDFRKIRWLRVDKFGFFKYRLSFDDTEEWNEVDIRGRHFSSDISIDLTELATIPGRPIAAAKVDDLKKQLPYIPRVHHGFYNSIISVEDSENADSSCSTAAGSDNENDHEY